MKEVGLPASLVTYHGLLNAKVQVGDIREAWRLVEELKSTGLVPNAVTCSILLKAFVTPAHAHDLSRVISLIESMDTPMDEVLFASVAEACIPQDDWMFSQSELDSTLRKAVSMASLLRLMAP
jgi:pentatricopeptide repeat protein